MADAALLQAIDKIATVPLVGEATKLGISMIANEAKLITQLPTKVEKIKVELGYINSLLCEMDTRRPTNQVVENWIQEVRLMAYRVVDTIDEYSFLDSQRHEGGLFERAVRRFHLGAIHHISEELTKIEENIADIKKRRQDWLDQFHAFAVNSNSHMESPKREEYSTQPTTEDDIVGIDENRKVLLEWLNGKQSALSIITVWGSGGIGKTTLVKNVYEREKNNFSSHAWVTVSKGCTVDAVLRELLKGLRGIHGNDDKIEKMDRSELRQQLSIVSRGKKYMIILDDIWELRAFDIIRDALVDNDMGSRILITTRKDDVASLCDENCKLHIQPLGHKEAYDLFCRKAFQKNDRVCPKELEDWAKQIVSKCDGLPLAILSIGGLLSLRPLTRDVWKGMYDRLQRELESNRDLDQLRVSLNLSYDDLPRHLKNCFLYCSIFPEDYLFSREQLVWMWISEGFVNKKGARATLEEIAEHYLMELVHVSMLIVVESDELGRVASCRMHDVVRELAILRCRREMFGIVYDDDTFVQNSNDVRRLSLLKCSKDSGPSMDLPRLRTLIASDAIAPPISLLDSVSSKSKYLAVLELQNMPLDTVPSSIENWFNLHYLGLKYTKVKSLPHSIGKLLNLETVDVRSTKIEALPHEIGKCKKLRHLLADKFADPSRRDFRYFHGVLAPKGTLCHLEELQTLETVQASKDLADQLKHLKNVRSLRIENVKGADCNRLFATVSTNMPLLSSLLVSASHEKEALCFGNLKPESVKLEKLIVRGCLSDRTFECSIFADHGKSMKYLALSWCQLKEDHFLQIAFCFRNLTNLRLRKVCCLQDLILYTESFSQLKTLQLRELDDVTRVTFEEGSVPILETLCIVSLPQLKEVPQGVERLDSLKKLYMLKLHHEFKASWKRNNWQSKLKNPIMEIFM